MDSLEAKILIKNLLQRFQPTEHGYLLSGDLTFSEYEALQHLLANNEPVKPQETQKLLQDVEQELDPLTPLPSSEEDKVGSAESEKNKTATKELLKQKIKELKARSAASQVAVDTEESAPRAIATTSEPVELFTSVLSLPQADPSKKICIDFGTAMSKVTLITDNDGFEEIEVLPLGEVTDQEEISSTMLVSSMYISNEGDLFFGKKAQDYSRIESTEKGEIRERIDNIKRALSEDGLLSELSTASNPTSTVLTRRDMVLAYLMYLTWAIRRSLEGLGEARNIDRRFAMPCLDDVKAKEIRAELSLMLGEAQILADTFYDELESHISITDFKVAVNLLAKEKIKHYGFMKESLTEPLGVANSLLSYEEESSVSSLVMIIDVGAGTTDFSMYRLGLNKQTGKAAAFGIAGSSIGVQQAGSWLDKILKAYILNKAGIDSKQEVFSRVFSSLDLDIQDYKEQLFVSGYCFARMPNNESVEVGLDEFLALKQVKSFAETLEKQQQEILEKVANKIFKPHEENNVSIVITGGGAELPMISNLATKKINILDFSVNLVRAKKVPSWIAEDYEDLADEYPRLAVSIGGARQKLIEENGTISTTANVSGTPTLEGSYAY